MDPITAGLSLAKQLVSSFFPDKSEEAKAKLTLDMHDAIAQSDLAKTAADIVKTEAASTSWLASSWRPITMLVFVGLIVARWFGFAAPNLQADEYIKLWDIVQLGLGGYVIGRSVEKVAPSLVGALKK